MRLAMKFGGSSISSGEQIVRVAEIAKKHCKEGDEIITVISAMLDVTDRLLRASSIAKMGDRGAIGNFAKAVEKMHSDAIQSSLKSEKIRDQAVRELKERVVELENALAGICHLRELTSRSLDYVLSFGERLSTPIVCAALKDQGLKASWLTGGDAGIQTDENFGRARPLINITAHNVKSKLEPLLKDGEVVVVTGFIGCSQDGAFTTFGRGGSDYTATLLGSILGADEVCLWTDVDGLMTADPKIEPSARTLASLSFGEALEMAYFGAKGMHPSALKPAAESGIPVRIRNTFNPANPGTLIRREETPSTEVAKTIVLIENVGAITVTGSGMVGTPGVAASIFSLLGEKKINVVMISQSSSESNISFIVERNSLDRAVNALELALLGGGAVEKVTPEPDVSIVAVIGAGMRGTLGVAARVFKCVADRGINVRMIAQGSSELNISFVVEKSDGPEAVRALHQEFHLGS